MSQLDVVLLREGGPLKQREARRTLADHIDHVAAIQAHVREAVQLAREDDETAYWPTTAAAPTSSCMKAISSC
jgi:hypothetical protein